jgi:tripartite-type tricarboxylate transporter receptor subunit TctC
MQTRRTFLTTIAFGVLALSGAATAQTFPARPITAVVPFPAGGPLDVLARLMGERMRQALGQPLVIENVSGAGGTIGVGRVARSAPDGHTLSFGYLGTHVLNGAIFPLQYDLVTAFEPVATLPSIPLLIAARHSMPAKNLNELMAWLKTNAHKATVATPGVGSPSHVMGVYLQKIAGTPMQFIHYRGGGPALQDLLAGHADLLINQPSILLPHMRDGKIKVYAVLAKNRLAQAPEIPTSDQEGIPDFHMTVWHGLWAPKATPKDIIAKLNTATRETMADTTVSKRLTELGYEIPTPQQQTPAALGDLQRAEIERWWPIIKAAGIKPE